MKVDKQIPFYSNTADDTHCFQAVLKILLKYFWPEEEYSWKQLEKITAKPEGLWTWTMAGLMWLKNRDVDIKVKEEFDYGKFAKKGGQYLIDWFGKEVGEAQIKHSIIEQERVLAKEFVEKIEIEKAIPTIEDIKSLLLKNYLVICNVNSKKLNSKRGYVGHSVLVKGLEGKQHLIIHDPGLPPLENRLVAFKVFEKAWAYPDTKAKNIMALKLNTKDRNTYSKEVGSHIDQIA